LICCSVFIGDVIGASAGVVYATFNTRINSVSNYAYAVLGLFSGMLIGLIRGYCISKHSSKVNDNNDEYRRLTSGS
jgi:ABC-type xylose transport system permease subunit